MIQLYLISWHVGSVSTRIDEVNQQTIVSITNSLMHILELQNFH
uniref:Uncharacterized protein n=1 Tax=Rhizophora mucronata TaxID=61149 RepID=A0A2P2NTN9_RHIMU